MIKLHCYPYSEFRFRFCFYFALNSRSNFSNVNFFIFEMIVISMIDSIYNFLSSFLQFYKKFFTEGRSEQCLPLNVPTRHWTGRDGGHAEIRQIANLRGKSHREWANSGVGSAGSGVLPDRAEADSGPLLGGALVPPIGMPFGRRLHGPRRDWRADCRTLDARDGKLYAECGGDLVYRPAGTGSLHGGAGYCGRWKGRSVGSLISWQKPSFFSSIFLQLDNCELISSFSNFCIETSLQKKKWEINLQKKKWKGNLWHWIEYILPVILYSRVLSVTSWPIGLILVVCLRTVISWTFTLILMEHISLLNFKFGLFRNIRKRENSKVQL